MPSLPRLRSCSLRRPGRWLFGFGVSFVFTLLAAKAQIPRPTLDEATAFSGATRYSYTAADGHTPLRLYVFPVSGLSSEKKSARPGVIFFHGSGWIEGWATQFSALARALAAQGMVTACADYRTQTNGGATPFDASADAQAAIRWMRTHADDLGLDAARLAAGGGSAGGHAALWAAIAPAKSSLSARPDALLLFSAVTDTTAEGYPAGVALFGGRERELSPRHHLAAGLPPMLLLQGGGDSWVIPASAERFAREATALGNRVDLVTFAGRGHAFYNSVAYRPGVRADDFYVVAFLAEKFFASLGWITAPIVLESAPSDRPTP